jgi:hypothetical protein
MRGVGVGGLGIVANALGLGVLGVWFLGVFMRERGLGGGGEGRGLVFLERYGVGFVVAVLSGVGAFGGTFFMGGPIVFVWGECIFFLMVGIGLGVVGTLLREWTLAFPLLDIDVDRLWCYLMADG